MEIGGYLLNNVDVRPGKFGRKPRLRPAFKVVNVGENSVACANMINSAVVAEPMVAKQCWSMVGEGGVTMVVLTLTLVMTEFLSSGRIVYLM